MVAGGGKRFVVIMKYGMSVVCARIASQIQSVVIKFLVFSVKELLMLKIWRGIRGSIIGQATSETEAEFNIRNPCTGNYPLATVFLKLRGRSP